MKFVQWRFKKHIRVNLDYKSKRVSMSRIECAWKQAAEITSDFHLKCMLITHAPKFRAFAPENSHTINFRGYNLPVELFDIVETKG